MPAHFNKEKVPSDQVLVTNHSKIHQAQDTDSASILTESTRKEGLLMNTDLITPSEDEAHTGPPAYGDIYGEIHSEQDGLGTNAHITDDGRVNIRINQLSRRFSQIFTPALDQHLHNAQDRPSTSPPTSSPPRLNIVMQVVGSRGDVQPFVALGKVLKDIYGHRVRLATHPTFKRFVQEQGLEFFSIGGDPSRLMAFMVKNPSLRPSMRSIASGDIGQRRRDVAEYIQGCWRSCHQVGDGTNDNLLESSADNASPKTTATHFVADLIIANPPSFAHIHCAERLGIPLHIVFTMPYSPTQAFPHPLANIQASNADPQLTNYISYAMIELLSWQALGDIINRFRAKCLGLDPVSTIWGPGMLQRLKIPHTYCWSPALIPKPTDWGSHLSVSGFCFLKAPDYAPAADLLGFLNRGPAPIYIGFGSIVLDDPNAMTQLIFEAVKETGQRVLLSKGWGGMGAEELHMPDEVFLLGNVPHDWLFQHVSCVVHHGGAGTTAAGIAAGRPTVIVPFFGDQPFWGAMIARAGAGPNPIPHKHLTADKLADAIKFCLRPATLARAKNLASKIAAEQGCNMVAKSIHRSLDLDRLCCSLVPSRSAVWRVKRTKIRLSAFAAHTLADANLLDLSDVKLFRPQEHYVDEGPWDPVSGGFTAFVGAVTGMSKGLYDVPSETWRAVQMPFAGPSEVQAGPKQDTASPAGRTSNNNHDMLRPTGVHVSKGAGRFVRALVQGPVNISVNLTRGMHNIPKLWGDDTVRPQERVSDFRTGVRAVGREFGFGFYDAITGLVTQPIKGAREAGAGGFVTGVGKGVGGFLPKLGAACLGILSHTLQGASKEVQRLFGSDVHSYIIASRAAQGYEEWLHSSDAEKQDVVAEWKLIQRVLKRKGKETVRGDEIEQEPSLERGLEREVDECPTEPTLPINITNGYSQDRDSPTTAQSGSRFPLHDVDTINTTPKQAVPEGSPGQPYRDPLTYDPRHLEGTTRNDFEAEQSKSRTEKTAEEKTEEEIVMEYTKRQSLLEAQHRMNGKGRRRLPEDEEDEDLQRALRESLQEQSESSRRASLVCVAR
ncbi:hypothetical protein N0V86_005458 [Didymella sp. IMI 355093]|nr:hypothetical protein N0V86_005458 [Didymella sp. IMI 355093]